MKNSVLRKLGKELALGLAFGLLSISIFAKIAEDLLEKQLNIFDQLAYNTIFSINSAVVTEVMKRITLLGSPAFLIFLCLIVWLYLGKNKKYWEANLIIVSLFGSLIMDEVLKWLFHRDRPGILPLEVAAGYSFPSGHAMVSFTCYGLLTYIIMSNTDSKKWKLFYFFLGVPLILSIGISRIYLGVHYASDVIAGYAAGGFWLAGCIIGLKTIRYYKNRTNAEI